MAKLQGPKGAINHRCRDSNYAAAFLPVHTTLRDSKIAYF